MDTILGFLEDIFIKNGLVMAFLVVGIIMGGSYAISKYLTRGRIHGSAIAILIGLVLAYIGGITTGGEHGLADIPLFAGIGTLGGSMLRDFTIMSSAFGARFSEVKKCGLVGVLALLIGVVLSFLVGAVMALCFGYSDAPSVATIGAGTVTFIVGPVTGAAVGASSEVIALSVGAGVIKSIVLMIVTPLAAKLTRLKTPKDAMIYGGLMGSTSGIAAGLAGVDSALVPYGAMMATFYSGLGCLLCPSVLYLLTQAILPG